ncbi:MAG: MBL fold metallo-hydrolase [Deltaproteobacteria bacterium]|nr:MBL fold metallo-hydrolase [Candidatus Zymogenaceae bacterium]
MKVHFTWVGGATSIITVDGLKIATDPCLAPAGTVQHYAWFKSVRKNDPVYAPGAFDDVDLWLITHGHEDHLDAKGVTAVRPGALVVTDETAREALEGAGVDDLRILSPGEHTTLEKKGFSIFVEAIPMVHGTLPPVARLAGDGNGYLVEITGDESRFVFYITGDSVPHRRVRRAIAERTCDLFIPYVGEARVGRGLRAALMGGLTMNMKMMGRLKRLISPRVTVPIHYGTFSHYAESVEAVRKAAGEGTTLLEPGETVEIPVT